MIRNCPICHVGKMTRKEVKTCGAPDCIAIWRTLTTSQRARAIEASYDVAEVDLPLPPAGAPKTPAQTGAENAQSSTERDNEALRRFFKEENPPGVAEGPSIEAQRKKEGGEN